MDILNNILEEPQSFFTAEILQREMVILRRFRNYISEHPPDEVFQRRVAERNASMRSKMKQLDSHRTLLLQLATALPVSEKGQDRFVEVINQHFKYIRAQATQDEKADILHQSTGLFRAWTWTSAAGL